MSDWMYWALGGFMIICTVGVVLALWDAEEIDGDDWE